MPRTDTRKKILEITERMLMQRGYHAFSYHHIAEELQIKPAAVHYHFRTKPLLVIATIERYVWKFDVWAETVADAGPAQRLLAYVDVGRQVVAWERVCALGMLNTQLAAVPSEVRDAAVAAQERILGFYVASLEAARDAGELAFDGPAADAAAAISCALFGAQQLSRAFGPAVYDRVMSQQMRTLGLEWPAPGASP